LYDIGLMEKPGQVL